MTTPPKSWMLAFLILLSVSTAASWFGRGIYDKLFMMEGRILVVNATSETHQIELAFPSGKLLNFELTSGASSEAQVNETGEGSVGVLVDGTRSDAVGYVTSRNSIMVLTVSDSKVVFSQMIP
jgi:hypothetical protein